MQLSGTMRGCRRLQAWCSIRVWGTTIRVARHPAVAEHPEALAHPTTRRLVLVATNWSSAVLRPLDSCYYPYKYQAKMLQTTTDDPHNQPFMRALTTDYDVTTNQLNT
jgi:hypothetical protein